MYLVFTRVPVESYRRRLRSLLLYLCYVFRVVINSFVLKVNSVNLFGRKCRFRTSLLPAREEVHAHM